MPEGGDDLRRRESEIGASLHESESLRERAQQASNSFKESYRAVSDQAGAARDSAFSLLSDLEENVRKNPLLCLLGALGLGIVLGSMTRR
jgi:hypothetical protein